MNKKIGFTIVTFYNDDKYDLLPLYNSLNLQSFDNWKWIVFSDNDQLNKQYNFFDDKKITQKTNSDAKKICSELKSEYILFVEPFVSLNNVYLETMYISQKEVPSDGIYFAQNVEKKVVNKTEDKIDRRIFSFSLSVANFNINSLSSYSFNTIINYLLSKIENQTIVPAAENIILTLSNNKPALMNKYAMSFPLSDKDDFDTIPYRFNYGEVIKKDKKRLLFVIPWLVIGGADKFNLDLLSGLDKDTYEVTIMLTRQSFHEWKYRFEEIESVKEIFDIPAFLPRIAWAGFFEYIMRTRSIDLVFFSNSLYGYHIIPWLKSYYPHIPFVDFLHAEDWFWKKGGLPRDSIAVSRFIDTTYSCTKHLVDVMKNQMNKQVDNDKVAYIGVDPYYYDRNKVNIDDYLNIKKYNGKKIITFVCRLVHLKRPFFMLEVLKKLVAIDNNYILFVIGDGPLYKDMINRANKMKLTDNVVFWGAQDDVRPFYYVSNATIVCSLTEGLALVSYESLSMGVPVVSSDVGGQSELINEEVGFIINRYQDYKNDLYNYDYNEEEILQYVNAVEKIVSDKNVPKLRKACRQKIVNKFSIQKTVDEISQDFLKLIEKGSSVDMHLCKNIELNERYLVIYNEASKFYKSGKLLGSASLVTTLWNIPIYRKTIRLLQKSGVMKVIKKTLRRK